MTEQRPPVHGPDARQPRLQLPHTAKVGMRTRTSHHQTWVLLPQLLIMMQIAAPHQRCRDYIELPGLVAVDSLDIPESVPTPDASSSIDYFMADH